LLLFGPTRDRDGTWRIEKNIELNNLIRKKNIINYIKAQKLSWFGHEHRMTYDKMVKNLYECKPISARLTGRPNIRWERDIEGVLRIIKIKN
jgi:hypothetical protein